MQQFPQFTHLPAELRIQIWKEAASTPSIHAFDVCCPSPSRTRCSLTRNKSGVLDHTTSGVYLDQIPLSRSDDTSNPRRDKEGQKKEIKCASGLPFDPSISIRYSCSEAFAAVRKQDNLQQMCLSRSNPAPGDNNLEDIDFDTVYLLGRGGNKYIRYNNAIGLLHLRFGPSLPTNSHMGILDPNGSAEDDYTLRVFKGSLSNVFLYPWSSGMVSTLQNARMVAFDAADLEPAMPLSMLRSLAPEALKWEVNCLAGRFMELELFYVVDYSIDRVEHEYEKSFDSRPKSSPEGSLSRSCGPEGTRCLARKLYMHPATASAVAARQPDVFYRNGVTYREVFDLEALGWSEESPLFVVLRMLCEEIWKQQFALLEGSKGRVPFQGVRVLRCR
ncbi:hypothetical protein BDV06DRAFT_218608 [Aspergillus oleicola]